MSSPRAGLHHPFVKTSLRLGSKSFSSHWKLLTSFKAVAKRLTCLSFVSVVISLLIHTVWRIMCVLVSSIGVRGKYQNANLARYVEHVPLHSKCVTYQQAYAEWLNWLAYISTQHTASTLPLNAPVSLFVCLVRTSVASFPPEYNHCKPLVDSWIFPIRQHCALSTHKQFTLNRKSVEHGKLA